MLPKMSHVPAVISVAPTGARRTKSDHPALPTTPVEIAREALACVRAGARVLHLHVRDEHGAHTLDAVRYRRAMDAVREAAGDALIVQVTTEAVGRYTPDEQMALVRELKPEACSIALRELAPDAAAEAAAAHFFASVHDGGIGLQVILYAADDAARLLALAGRARLGPTHGLFVLGRYATGQRATPDDLLPFLDVWPPDWPWTVCAFGPDEALCLQGALVRGGHVRVGFENNLLRPDGSMAADNAEQVTRVAAMAEALGRPLASIAQARETFGLTV
jgi:uncharacterized protein (DUF849 family)